MIPFKGDRTFVNLSNSLLKSVSRQGGSCYRLREIRNVKAEVPAKKTEVATDYAKYAT
ncbi:MAG: hypothetical protein ACR9NN_15605 [Nostochopsis sp.]